MRDPLIALGLQPRGVSPDPSSPAQKLIKLLLEFAADVDPIDTGTLVDRMDLYRLLAESQADAQRLAAMTDACADVCREVRDRIRTQQKDQKSEIAALVTLVHETLATLGGTERGFQSSFGDSLSRLSALSDVDDVRQLKMQLAREVALVRQLAVSRQKDWEETCTSLTDRVRTLEQRLSETTIAATIDMLTKLTSRGAFDAIVREWLSSPRRRFVLALLDLDGLKTINDTYGHPAGDRAIVTVANALKDSFRMSVDVVARYGGDEFALLAGDIGFREAEKRLRMVVTSLQATPIELGEGEPVALTVSCGMAEYTAGDTLESLVERADKALYEAKRSGRDRIVSKQKPTLRSLLRH